MGEPATPTQQQRAATRAAARTIIECVRDDEEMRLGLSVGRAPGGARIVALADVEQLAFNLAQEIELLRGELGAIAKSAEDYMDAKDELEAVNVGEDGWRHACKNLGDCRADLEARIEEARRV